MLNIKLFRLFIGLNLILFTHCAGEIDPPNAKTDNSEDSIWNANPGTGSSSGVLGPNDRTTSPSAPAQSGSISEPHLLIGAGDISKCSDGEKSTAELLKQFPTAEIFTLGDANNMHGTLAEYQSCFDKSWGQYKSRIHPTMGNHEDSDDGQGYFDYFGAAAGERAKGYYSYDLGAWHIVVLNGNCDLVGGCKAGGPMEKWLRADLTAHSSKCSLAYWHQPRFSSGDSHGSDEEYADLWRALYENKTELVLNGHDHLYERFAPQDPSGKADAKGIRQFIVGTGGAGTRDFADSPEKNSEVRINSSFGLLKLSLNANSYAWEFLPVGGGKALDSGSTDCH